MSIDVPVKVSLDGRPCMARAGQTLLELARERGLSIPTLCHDDRLEPEAACWLCIVEVQTPGGWQVVPSCATKVTDGLQVRTDSEVILAGRRQALELLLSDHYADCVAPCTLTCPAGVDVPGYLEAVSRGQWTVAIERIRRTNPLPSVCGRVCPHTCEAVCRLNLSGEPAAINEIKRLAADQLQEPLAPPRALPSSGHRVAVVGAGPAGLSASWFLALQGHSVDLYDAHERPGGLLRYGIPAYRLPRDVLDADLVALEQLGVRFHGGQRLGRDLSVDGLRAEGHDAVFVALGAWQARPLRLDGEDAEGVMGGLAFLERVNDGTTTSLDGTVAVIGGGNSAIDASRAAIRLGASRVQVLYRRDRDQMPAFPQEVEAAIAEGVELVCLVAPVGLALQEGRLRAVRLQRMRLGPVDASGRPRPVPIEGEELTLEVDLLLTAVGELPGEGPGAWGEGVDAATGATDVPGVFAGGDFVTGASTVVEAIASGRRVAVSIDTWLRQGEAIQPPAPRISRRVTLGAPTAEDCPPRLEIPRLERPHRPAQERVRDFADETLDIDPAAGRAEASRCLKCGCSSFSTCELRAQMDALGVEQGAFDGEVHRYLPETLRPGLKLDMNKCIRCTRCVRMCRDVVGAEALEFVLRGFDSRLLFAMQPGSAADTLCTRCLASGGLCVDTCPTGALTFEAEVPPPTPQRAP